MLIISNFRRSRFEQTGHEDGVTLAGREFDPDDMAATPGDTALSPFVGLINF